MFEKHEENEQFQLELMTVYEKLQSIYSRCFLCLYAELHDWSTCINHAITIVCVCSSADTHKCRGIGLKIARLHKKLGNLLQVCVQLPAQKIICTSILK